ncbi:hypothetical protein IJ579_02000 [bacterium]|nr:hypothetical protein [bacterium]
MEITKYINYVPIIIVALTFLFSIFYCMVKYSQTGSQLSKIIQFISKFKKSELNFRFKEIDNGMYSNPYISSLWQEFKNSLVFSESVALENNNDIQYQDVSSTVQNIQTTVDPLYFFNEETLITSRFNFKLIQTMPTILTGCGPLFTFLNIALAFGIIDFSSPENTISSMSNFILSMQMAALVSVVAVGASLIYLMIERLLYNKVCKERLNKVQEIMGALFASISSEKFLYELLREAKIGNNMSKNRSNHIPEEMKTVFDESMSSNLVPYLENLIFGLNTLNKQLKESIRINQDKSDMVDDLF